MTVSQCNRLAEQMQNARLTAVITVGLVITMPGPQTAQQGGRFAKIVLKAIILPEFVGLLLLSNPHSQDRQHPLVAVQM